MKFDALSSFMSDFGSSLASVAKVILLSKKASGSSDKGKGKSLVIMGNGPSLRQTLEEEFDQLVANDLMAVNFVALSPEFFRLRPQYYLLADGHFFRGVTSDSNVKKLWETLRNVSWDITLCIPANFRHLVQPLVMGAHNIKLRYFNLTPVEGFRWLRHFLWGAALGMPRPRNVLIPAIMEGIRLGYDKIYLCGADHSWTKTLDVDEENFVVSVQPHFYEDNEEEHKRVRETYKGLRLHDVLGSMTVAFRSHCLIEEFARRRKVEVINATPGSMIDAYRRGKIKG